MPELEELTRTAKSLGVAAIDAAEKALAVGVELGQKAADTAHSYAEVARSLLA